MRTKVLHYAAGRDDKIVATLKEVTFISKYIGRYVDAKDERHENLDNIAIVERVEDVCFVVEFLSRSAAFDKEHLAAVEAEACDLQTAMQERIAHKQWIPLTYVAAYVALGWDARPLKEHRANMRAWRMAETRDRKRLLREREEHRQETEEQEWQEALLNAEKAFRNGLLIESEFFIGLCRKYEIKIHPRTLGLLRRRITLLSRTYLQCKGGDWGNRAPSVKGCSRIVDCLMKKLE